jgi:hypothetical protein
MKSLFYYERYVPIVPMIIPDVLRYICRIEEKDYHWR